MLLLGEWRVPFLGVMLASPLTFVFKERSQLYLLDSALLLLFQFNDLSLALAAAPCLRGQILKQLAIVQPTFKIVLHLLGQKVDSFTLNVALSFVV